MSHTIEPSPRPAGPKRVAAVIFDWAGTILDFGCMAPVDAFRQAFAEQGITISDAEARAPMGTAKREHIALILAQPPVQRRWRDSTGQDPTDADTDRIYRAFLRIDGENSERYSTLIPGVRTTVQALHAREIVIGSTTGYPRSIMDRLIPLAAGQGYLPNHVVTVDDVARGRPWPDMLLANVTALGIHDVRACVAVDDSPSGLVSARASGMWAVGVTVSGNEVGLPLEHWNALDHDARRELREKAERKLRHAGAHVVIDSVADLPAAIDSIEESLATGIMP